MTDHGTSLGGHYSARFEPLRELFAAQLESGEDLGASLAVTIDGEMVINFWGGWADESRILPWTRAAEDRREAVMEVTNRGTRSTTAPPFPISRILD